MLNSVRFSWNPSFSHIRDDSSSFGKNCFASFLGTRLNCAFSQHIVSCFPFFSIGNSFICLPKGLLALLTYSSVLSDFSSPRPPNICFDFCLSFLVIVLLWWSWERISNKTMGMLHTIFLWEQIQNKQYIWHFSAKYWTAFLPGMTSWRYSHETKNAKVRMGREQKIVSDYK